MEFPLAELLGALIPIMVIIVLVMMFPAIIGALIGQILRFFKNIFCFPTGYYVSNQYILHMLSPESVSHSEISTNDMLHETYNNLSLKSILPFVVCYNNCQPS